MTQKWNISAREHYSGSHVESRCVGVQGVSHEAWKKKCKFAAVTASHAVVFRRVVLASLVVLP